MPTRSRQEGAFSAYQAWDTVDGVRGGATGQRQGQEPRAGRAWGVGRVGLGGLLLAMAATVVGTASAAVQFPLPPIINLTYAAEFGFGGYSYGGASVQIFTLPRAYSFEDFPKKGWKFTPAFPIQYGHYSGSATVPQFTRSETDNSFAAIPGAYLQIPLLDRWTLTPFFLVGPIYLFSAKEWGVLYTAGVKTLYQIPWHGFRFGFGLAAVFAGSRLPAHFDSEGDEIFRGTENYGVLRAGTFVRHDLGFRIGKLTPDIGPLFVFHHFFPSAKFVQFEGELGVLDVRNQYQIGATMGSSTPFSYAILNEARLGASYVTGDGLSGVKFTFGFPF